MNWKRRRERTFPLDQPSIILGELAAAQAYLDAILANSLDGILLLTADLHVARANQVLHQLFGRQADELTGCPLRDLIAPADVGMAYTAAEKAYKEQVAQQIELSILRKDSTQFLAEVRIHPSKGHGLVCNIRDVEERQATQTRLAEERNLLRTLIDAMPDLIYMKDCEHRFSLCNRAAGYLLHNQPPDWLIGKTDFDLFPHALATRLYGYEREVFESGQSLLNQEEQIVDWQGRELWMATSKVLLRNLQGEIVGLAGFSHNITQRKQYEQQLHFYASLQENVNDAVITTDLALRIQSWNRAAERIYGWQATEVIGRYVNEILQTQCSFPKTSAWLVQEWHQQGRWQGELVQFHKNGTSLYILQSLTLLKDERGVPFGMVAVNHDITERQRAEAALHEMLTKERELGELKSRFISMASHEFRTPLASILMLTETLAAYRHKLTEAQIMQRLDSIREQVGHLKLVMEDMLQLAQMQARRVVPMPALFNLDEFCCSIMDEFRHQLVGAQQFGYHCNRPAQMVFLDKRLMRQVISNLLSNALKYSSVTGIISLHLTYTGDTVVLQIHDEGIGIPEADLPHLFQPFHRATNVGTISGTGLGLVITKEAVELHGGTIAVTSQVGRGTTVIVTLPLAT
ncbi:MAG: PAS domain-containing sensor histidine kinase [Caldilineaceae bacterium]|nr:PAS domain-containing sensor histidine kinase [Caldilineaceae bacterium]